MRFEAVIVGIGAAGTAVLATTGALGYRGVRGTAGLEPHLMFAVATAVAVLFAHVWVLVFLLATGRGLRRAAGSGAAGITGLASARRLAIGAIGLAVAALGALLLSGATAYTETTSAGAHAGLFWAALVLQVAALVAEWRALGANTALISALDR